MMSEEATNTPTNADFMLVLSEEVRWLELGAILGASCSELKEIELNYPKPHGVKTWYLQLYDCLEKKDISITWETLANGLDKLGNLKLAQKIRVAHFPTGCAGGSTFDLEPHPSEDASSSRDDPQLIEVDKSITKTYSELLNDFEKLLIGTKRAVKNQNIDLDEVQDVIQRRTGLKPIILKNEATPNAVLGRMEKTCTILNFTVLSSIVENLLDVKSLDTQTLSDSLNKFTADVEQFKSSENMVKLVNRIKESKQVTNAVAGQTMVTLKVRQFWHDFTTNKFEIMANELFQNLYKIMSPVSAENGCVCFNWIIPDIDVTELLPQLPLEFIRLIGVIYLHIGSKVIYNIEGDGCDSIEAAMLQAIELKNTRAIEIFTALGYDQTKLRPNATIAECTPSVAVLLPYQRRRLGVKAEMKVKVTTRDVSGKELVTGGSFVRAVLTCNDEECPVTDNNDGTYIITVIPQQLGQHQLSITVNGRYIQDNPFTLDIVPQRDYTRLNTRALLHATCIKNPKYIAFSHSSGDMLVTSTEEDKHLIHVCANRTGTVKYTMTCSYKGCDKIPFKSSYGIDVHNDTIYVAECFSHTIHQLTTRGEFVCRFGNKGSAIGQFNSPYDVKIGPEGKVYVADTYNDRVQVFNPDWSISHVIDGNVSGDAHFLSPHGIAFDLSGNVHVSGYRSSSITVYDCSGQFVRRYEDRISFPTGIAIDSSGYCLVNEYDTGTLLVFDSNTGKFITSVGGLNNPYGVSVSPVNGSVWVADTANDQIIKY